VNGAWLASYVVMWVLLLVVGFLVLGLLRQVGLLNERLVKTDQSRVAGLDPGATAPLFHAIGLNGREISLGGLMDQEKTVLLVFASPRCGPCVQMASVFEAFYQRVSDRGWEVLMVGVGTGRAGVEAYARDTGVHFPLIAQERDEISLPYKFAGSPFAFVLHGGIVKARRKVEDEQQFAVLLREGGFSSTGNALLPAVANGKRALFAGR
jgi:peroxiredoxin